MLRIDRLKYVWGQQGKLVALYDLRKDPDEDHNVAGDPAYRHELREMHARLRKVMADDGDPLVAKMPEEP